jgi:hypothetical protein
MIDILNLGKDAFQGNGISQDPENKGVLGPERKDYQKEETLMITPLRYTLERGVQARILI